MREIRRRRIQRAAQKLLIFFGLMALMLVPGSSQTVPVAGQRTVLVSIPDRKLAVLEDGKVLKIYPVAVGAPASPSPSGEFEIVNRIDNPTYYHPHVVIPAGADSPIGTRWLGLNKKGYGIHGTNAPRSVGRAASHGCIRMRNRDMEQFFKLVRVADRVQIRAARDAQTEQVFGGATGVVQQAAVADQSAAGQ